MGSVYMELPIELTINASLEPRLRCPSSGVMVPTLSEKENAFSYVESATWLGSIIKASWCAMG